ncbi:MAG TPA: hypothetical protein VK704_07185 [Acidimicrobiales bacterium]|nr:hypothetical protein [Acidimicrobiales bacterium]
MELDGLVEVPLDVEAGVALLDDEDGTEAVSDFAGDSDLDEDSDEDLRLSFL